MPHTPQISLGISTNNRTAGSWENDCLDRKKYAVQLEQLIANTPGPYVIGMTSSWGSGKTFFLTAWRQSLLNRPCPRPCVYFNAWETDHAGDPLVALAAHISQQVKELLGIEDDIFDLIQTKASQIARKAPKALIGILIGLFNRYTGSEITKEMAQFASDAFEVGTAGFLQTEKTRSEFRQAIQELSKKAVENCQLETPDRVNNSTKFPLLVIIDELDRCRPDYAITLLESIKHLFNEPGIVFLISMDSVQLLSVIEHTFGLHEKTSGTNADIRLNYLRKFIDIFWVLPEPDAKLFVLQNLLSRRPAIPRDWPVASREGFRALTALQDDDPLFSPNSYYYTLASAAIGKQKSLRELLQILEKFFVLSSCYSMNTRESFVIFDMLMACPDDTKKQDMSHKIRQTGFSPQAALRRNERSVPDERDVGDQDPFLTLYTFIIENAHEQTVPQFKAARVTPGGTPRYTDLEHLLGFYLNSIFTPFSGEKLTESVTQKISFLDEFHFGE